MKSFLIATSILLIVALAEARIYEKCEIAREMHNKYGYSREDIPNYVCIFVNTKFNTQSVIGPNNDNTFDYGLFMINSGKWCNIGSPGMGCNADCSDFQDDDIADDVECVKKIYVEDGYNGWSYWKEKCQDSLPSIDECF